MSVVVRMEMPHDGLCDLAFSFLDRTCCTIEGNLCNYCDDGVIPKWCPIVCALPENHGNLIDLETAAEGLSERYNSCHMTCGAVMQFLDGLPTIVPAEAERSET